ncbi:MAG: N-6 DNA methylase [Ilumatobacteraceae bacterium]
MPAQQVPPPVSRRKQLGAWYTPEALVDHVVALTARAGRTRRPVVVVDPACGDGRFLAAARRALGPRARLVGVDIDPGAVASARAAVPDAEIIEADALSFDWSGIEADVVVGNPPFLSQMATATLRAEPSRFGGGPYADVAADFLALSVAITRPGGRVGLVLPQSILTTRDTAPIRTGVAERAAIVHAWWSTTRVFSAHVHTCALVLQVGAVQAEVTRTFGTSFAERPAVRLDRSWGALLLDGAPVDAVEPGGPCLGDIATVSVDFRDQYYGLVGAVGDDVDGPPLVTSGLIDPGRCLWGQRPTRFAKQRYEAPRVDLSALTPKLQRWAANRLVPKVLVANQARTIESVIDAPGVWLPSVPVLTCVGGDLDRIHAVLSSPTATSWVRLHAAGSGLSHDSVRLTPSLLASIPL